MKDSFINNFFLGFASKVLPILMRKDEVVAMLDKSDKSEAQIRFSTVQLIAVLCFLVAAGLLLVGVVLYNILRFLGLELLADIVLSFLIWLPLSLAIIMGVKLYFLHGFNEIAMSDTLLPEGYFYKACDRDFIFAALMSTILTVIFVFAF